MRTRRHAIDPYVRDRDLGVLTDVVDPEGVAVLAGNLADLETTHDQRLAGADAETSRRGSRVSPQCVISVEGLVSGGPFKGGSRGTPLHDLGDAASHDVELLGVLNEEPDVPLLRVGHRVSTVDTIKRLFEIQRLARKRPVEE